MKKLFTLLVLLVAIVTGAWAQNATTLFEYDMSQKQFTTGADRVTTNNVSIGSSSVKINTNSTTVYGINFGSSYKVTSGVPANYLKLEPEGGFKAGDVITIAGVFNNSDDTKEARIGIYGSDDVSTQLFLTDKFINGRTVASDPVAQEFTLGNDVDALYFGRYGNTGTQVLTLKIVRPIHGAVDPVFSLTKSKISTNGTSQIQVGTKGNLDGITLVDLTSSNTSVATVDATGLITPVGVGTTNITFTSNAVTDKYNAVTTTVTLTLDVTNTASCYAYLNGTAGSARTQNCTFKFYSDEGAVGTIPAGELKGEYYEAKINSDKNYYEVTLADGSYTQFEAGDVITVYLYTNNSSPAFLIGTAKTKVELTGQTSGQIVSLTHTLAANEIEENGTIRIYRSSSNTYFAGVAVEGDRTPATAPVITTQPVGATYVSGDPIAALTVEATASAGTLSYQWYSCDDANKTNAAAIENATSASYTPSGAGFYYVKVTDANDNIDSDVVEISISAAYAPIVTATASATEVAKETKVTMTATCDALPAATEYQWYSCEDASKTNPTAISGATALTYEVTPSTTGTYYYYFSATNTQGTTTSDVITLTVNASNKCKLSAVNYSNGFKAFINQPGEGNGTVVAYYMEGTTAPTIASVEVSEGASCTESGNTLTVTAEDGTTTAVFDITLAAVAPYTGTGTHTFDGNETWVKTGNTFSSNGWKIARSYENDDEGKYMISQGSNRAYLFLGPNASVTITQGGTARSMKASVNGGAYGSATNKDIVVTGDATAPYMVEITQTESGGGDGAIKSITTPVPVTITSAGAASFSSTEALDFSAVEGITAYKATAKSDSYVHLDEVAQVPAGAGVIVKGAEGIYNVPVATGDVAELEGNLLVGTGENPFTVTSAEDGKVFKYVKTKTTPGVVGFQKAKEGWTCQAGHAYLMLPETSAREFIGIFDEDISTGIEAIDNSQLTIDNDAPAYNLAGQKVGKGYKGIVIINGKKVVK